MKKHTIILFLVLITGKAWSCPACNIHNYLDETIRNSSIIYKGKVLKALEVKKSVGAVVLITEIIRIDTTIVPQWKFLSNFNIKAGDLDTIYFYNAKENVGKEFIISNPRGHQPTFEIVPAALEDEIKFLMDSAATVNSTEQAISLVEGISWYSYKVGSEYIEQHYEESYEKLCDRLQAYRILSFNNPDIDFAEYKIYNLARVLLSKTDARCQDFILREIDSIANFSYRISNLDKIPFRGETAQGNYLEAILRFSKDNEDFHKKVVAKLHDYLKKENDTSSIYIVYAMSGDTIDTKFFKNLPIQNKFNIALGLLYRAKNFDGYWNTDEKDKTVKKALDIYTDKRMQKIIKMNYLTKK